jgi:N-acetylmuramate 1-kinase
LPHFRNNIKQSMSTPDIRLHQLTQWTCEVLAHSDLAITVASADASFRRYFRVTRNANDTRKTQTWIVMDAPPEKEDLLPYINVAQKLVAADINAPRVLAKNIEQGFLLLSDLGNATYLTELAKDNGTESLYRDALIALVQMQSRCRQIDDLPPYDAKLLLREMELFPEWFMGKHLNIAIDDSDRAKLDSAFSVLVESALSQPKVFVHRDYHSRNLMITDNQLLGRNPGVLDFQDAVRGPITYDLVSLLRDCYVAWPIGRVHGWLTEYRALAEQAGLQLGSPDQLQRSFDLMGVQRHLKAVGIFARLWHRDGKRGYLNDIPRTLSYVRDVAPLYEELRPLVQLIEQKISPALARLV